MAIFTNIEESFFSDLSNAYQDIKYMLKNKRIDAQQNGNFEALRPNLLDMVNNAKSMDRINYLRKDLQSANYFLDRLADNVQSVQDGKPNKNLNVKQLQKRIDQGLTVQKIKAHKSWLKGEYRQALNKRASELRAKNESYLSTYLDNVIFD